MSFEDLYAGKLCVALDGSEAPVTFDACRHALDSDFRRNDKIAGAAQRFPVHVQGHFSAMSWRVARRAGIFQPRGVIGRTSFRRRPGLAFKGRSWDGCTTTLFADTCDFTVELWPPRVEPIQLMRQHAHSYEKRFDVGSRHGTDSVGHEPGEVFLLESAGADLKAVPDGHRNSTPKVAELSSVGVIAN